VTTDLRTLLLATTNRGKAREFAALLDPLLEKLGLRTLTLADIEQDHHLLAPDENALTFAENALLKARHYSRLTGLLTLADDSGLCVQALNGAPGVHSARYGGLGLDDRGRVQVLLSNLSKLPGAQNSTGRRAYFEAALALVWHGALSEGLTFSGLLEGKIAMDPSGDGGFGYDPIFIPDGTGVTLAQITQEEKNAISHRARAIESMKNQVTKIEAWLCGFPG
jgi:XTP/dITP diphosphohydrolase